LRKISDIFHKEILAINARNDKSKNELIPSH